MIGIIAKLRSPWIDLMQVVLMLLLMFCFVNLVAFLGVTPAEQLRLQGIVLPAGWEAGVMSHGSYLEGILIRNHRVQFGFLLAGLLFAWLGSVLVRFAVKRQLATATPEELRHRRALRFVGGLLAAVLVFIAMTIYVAGGQAAGPSR